MEQLPGYGDKDMYKAPMMELPKIMCRAPTLWELEDLKAKLLAEGQHELADMLNSQ